VAGTVVKDLLLSGASRSRRAADLTAVMVAGAALSR